MPRGLRLLEREDELAQLSELVKSAREAAGAVAVVEGPPGIGKTRLLGALAGMADQAGMEVLDARGGERERDFAFGVARQLFEAPVRAAAESEREVLLSSAAALAAPLVDPEHAIGQAPQPQPDPFPLLHGLYWLTANLAERAPLALVVDDAHWADGPSLWFLHYLSRRVDGVPVLLALACRSTSPEAPVEPIEAIKQETTTLVRPSALSEAACAAVLADLFGTDPAPEFAHAAYRAAGGNPFLLGELARSLAADGIAPDAAAAAARLQRATPETISRATLTRLARLPRPARELARAAALLGEDAELRHAAALASLEEDEALAAADGLTAAGFLGTERGPGAAPTLRFSHPLIRQVLYADLPQGERSRRHKQAARLVSEGGSPERVATHLLETAPAGDQWVVVALREAASDARRSGAPEIAASYLRRALAEPPAEEERGEVLFALGSAEALIEGPAAMEHLGEAFELVTEPGRRATIGAALAHALIFAARPREAVEVAQRAATGLGEADTDLRQRLEARIFSTARMETSLADLREELAERLRREGIEGEGLGAKGLMAGLARVEALACVPAAEAVALAERALEGGVLLGEDNGGPDYSAVMEVLALADSELALVTAEAGLAVARRRGDVFGFAANKLFGCLVHLTRGELTDAVGDGEACLAAADAHGGLTLALSWGVGFLVSAQIERGELDDAERTLARATTEAEVPDNVHWHWFLSSRALLRIARGDLQQGLAESLECGRRYAAAGGKNPAFMPWRSRAALCLTGLGEEPERALQLAAEEVALAHTWGGPRALGAALRAQGLVLGGADGIDLLREAVEILDGSPARLEHARALTDLGAALRRANHRAEAREPLTQAIELARACGARPLTERAHAELRATGARPRHLVYTGLESLTARERQVAQLAAEGCSNPEVAQQLFVTRKTVETHLGSVYRKLGIDAREGLADALAAQRG